MFQLSFCLFSVDSRKQIMKKEWTLACNSFLFHLYLATFLLYYPPPQKKPSLFSSKYVVSNLSKKRKKKLLLFLVLKRWRFFFSKGYLKSLYEFWIWWRVWYCIEIHKNVDVYYPVSCIFTCSEHIIWLPAILIVACFVKFNTYPTLLAISFMLFVIIDANFLCFIFSCFLVY